MLDIGLSGFAFFASVCFLGDSVGVFDERPRPIGLFIEGDVLQYILDVYGGPSDHLYGSLSVSISAYVSLEVVSV